MERAKSSAQSAQPAAEGCKCLKDHTEWTRNLVVCIDGTSNKFGKMNTNVIELYSLLEKNSSQITFYNSGIGTYAQPSWTWSLGYWLKVLGHKIDLGIAWDFESIMLAAYEWLSENYQPGDRIFLFGFSRGAYQVRCLSAMIETVGLIYRGNEAQIPFAFEIYAKSDRSSTEAARFKLTFGRDINVHFVGAWDTVSSVGIFRARRLPNATSGMNHVCYFRHALALDERRVKFMPEYASKMFQEAYADNGQNIPHTKEVWFAGTHSDIGGGNVANMNLDRSQPPLRWMSYEAALAGLRMLPYTKPRDLTPPITIHNSLTWTWWLLEILVWRKVVVSGTNGPKSKIRRPGHGRYPRPGQMIYSSVFRTNADRGYKPKASTKYLHPSLSSHIWLDGRPQESRLGDLPRDVVEYDLYDSVIEVVREVAKAHESPSLSTLHANLRKMILETDGSRALREISQSQHLPSLQDGGHLPRDVQSYLLRVLLEHQDDYDKVYSKTAPKMSALAVSPDGSIIALVESLDRTIRLEDPTQLATILNPTIRSESLRTEKTKLIEEMKQTEEPMQNVKTLDKHTDSVVCLAFSPCGKYLASGGWDHKVYLWDVEAVKDITVFGPDVGGHTNPVTSIAFSPNGNSLASGSLDGTIIFWDYCAHEKINEENGGYMNTVTSLYFSKDGTLLVSGTDDGSVHLWNTKFTPQIPFFHEQCYKGHTQAVISLAVSPNNRHLASGSYDYTVRIWDVQSNKAHARVVYGHTGWVTAVAFSLDSAFVVSGSSDTSICVWDTTTGRSSRPPITLSDWISSVEFSSDGHTIMSRTPAGLSIAHDFGIPSASHETLYGHRLDVRDVTFSPTDSNCLVSCSGDYRIRFWDVRTGTQSRHPLEGHTDGIWSIQFSPDGQTIVTGSDDTTVRLWDARTGTQMGKPFAGHKKGVNCVAFSPDGTHLVTGSDDFALRVGTVDSGFGRSTALHGHTARVWYVQYSSDGQYIVSASEDRTVRLWDAKTGSAVGEPLYSHDGSIYNVAFSPDGSYLATPYEDCGIRIWNVKTRTAVNDFRGHVGPVMAVAYSPDGRYIVSGSSDCTVRVWDATLDGHGRKGSVLNGHNGSVWSVAISSDGQYIASASDDGTIRLWDAERRKPIVF